MASRRSGRTVKISVSLDREDLRTFRRRAKAVFGGNLSASLSEAARLLRQREARDRLIDWLGGPTLTPEIAAALEAEQAGGPRYEPKKFKQRKTRVA
jgi:hypothetical protein